MDIRKAKNIDNTTEKIAPTTFRPKYTSISEKESFIAPSAV